MAKHEPQFSCPLYRPCIDPNQELQIDFAGPINNENEHEIYISTESFKNANDSNVKKFISLYTNPLFPVLLEFTKLVVL